MGFKGEKKIKKEFQLKRTNSFSIIENIQIIRTNQKDDFGI